MHEAGLATFVVVFGFVIAAILYSIRKTIEQRDQSDSDLRLSPTPGNIAYSMFAGPFLVASRLVAIGIGQRANLFLVVTGGLIAILWSFCSGILVVQALALVGVIAI